MLLLDLNSEIKKVLDFLRTEVCQFHAIPAFEVECGIRFRKTHIDLLLFGLMALNYSCDHIHSLVDFFTGYQ
ncbi:hypothetical protein D3C71_1058120 [compost metagenome]